jgi:hypothetical protein
MSVHDLIKQAAYGKAEEEEQKRTSRGYAYIGTPAGALAGAAAGSNKSILKDGVKERLWDKVRLNAKGSWAKSRLFGRSGASRRGTAAITDRALRGKMGKIRAKRGAIGAAAGAALGAGVGYAGSRAMNRIARAAGEERLRLKKTAMDTHHQHDQELVSEGQWRDGTRALRRAVILKTAPPDVLKLMRAEKQKVKSLFVTGDAARLGRNLDAIPDGDSKLAADSQVARFLKRASEHAQLDIAEQRYPELVELRKQKEAGMIGSGGLPMPSTLPSMSLKKTPGAGARMGKTPTPPSGLSGGAA